MPIEISCRTCGQPYVPTREDLARGPEFYYRCPACRPPEERDPGVAD
jgi:hypothetical protein